MITNSTIALSLIFFFSNIICFSYLFEIDLSIIWLKLEVWFSSSLRLLWEAPLSNNHGRDFVAEDIATLAMGYHWRWCGAEEGHACGWAGARAEQVGTSW